MQFLDIVEQERSQNKVAKGELELLKKAHRELAVKHTTLERELKAAKEDRLSLNERLAEMEKSTQERHHRTEAEMQKERGKRIELEGKLN